METRKGMLKKNQTNKAIFGQKKEKKNQQISQSLKKKKTKEGQGQKNEQIWCGCKKPSSYVNWQLS